MRIKVKRRRIWDRVLSIILALAVVGALGTLGYVTASPQVGEKFTEFYTLGLSGKATDYPKELAISAEAKVIVGIINQERETVTYRVEVANEFCSISGVPGSGWSKLGSSLTSN